LSSEPAKNKPRTFAVAGLELAMAWGDGHESYLPFNLLRTHCPCAPCRVAAGRSDYKGPERPVADPPPMIVDVEPVGAYAMRIVWSDGHREGIYPFEMLRSMCPCERCAGQTASAFRADRLRES